MAVLQPLKNNWITGVPAALALASSSLVAFNHTFFKADDRAYQKVARHARRKLQEYGLQLNQYGVLDQETKTGLYDKFGKLQQDIDDFETAMIYGGTASNAPGLGMDGLFATTAQADQHSDSVRIPEWAEKVPIDDRNIYFLGIGEATTFDGARDNALAKAREVASETVANAASTSPSLAGQPQLIEKMGKALAGSAKIVETFTVPSSAGGFQSFVLLRVSKSAATFTAQSVFVESSVPYDTLFLDKVKTGISGAGWQVAIGDYGDLNEARQKKEAAATVGYSNSEIYGQVPHLHMRFRFSTKTDAKIAAEKLKAAGVSSSPEVLPYPH